ncbi:35623_t:CDS:2 [Racocetra persica]|uniref:35623_t:CDS:1 n=1 Tax=Racocetra persica TaxID=160502 RepID=A0ACA9KX76_9GLOM|nr:35623_t:CDS:2 [Racocetra persica]
MYFYLAAIIAFISYAFYKCYIYPLYLSPLRKIPGPPVDNIILGHHASFLNKELGEAFTYLLKQYGGIVKYHGLFNEPNILISDPKLVQQVLVNRPYEYPKLFLIPSMAKEFFGGDGILLAEGDTHKRQRKMMSPSFAFTNVKEMVPTFVQAGHKLKNIWMKQIGNKKEERITITVLIPKITLDVIGHVGFNYEFNSTTSGSELARAYQTIVDQNCSLLYMALASYLPFIRKLPTDHNNKYFDSVKVINNVSEKLIAEQKNSPVRGKDLLSLLIKSNENLPVMTLLLAGHETTSGALSWVLYFLAKNPDVQERLRKEVLDILPDRNRHPTIDEIEHLKYLELPAIRRCTSKDEIMNGYLIPKNTPLWIPIYAIHHDPLIWGDDADYFNPSRWLDPEVKSRVTSSNFLPFSAGPKNCLGMKMAQLEFKSILSVLIRNFEFKLVEGFTFKKLLTGISKPVPGLDLWVSKLDY